MASILTSYVFQSVLHSLVSLFIIEFAVAIWGIQDPARRFGLRLQILLLPPFFFPFFQLLDPQRGSFYFRQDYALFVSGRWLALELPGGIPLGILLVSLLAATAAVTLLQEIRPIVQDLRASSNPPTHAEASDTELLAIVARLSRKLAVAPPPIFLLADQDPIILVRGARRPSLFVSQGLVKAFSPAELQSVLAHELAHLVRRSTLTSNLVFLVRLLMFYNPISMLVFRRLIQDDEEICDQLTLSATDDASSLISALGRFRSHDSADRRGWRNVVEIISRSSHNLLLADRIRRLERDPPVTPPMARLIPVLTLILITGVNYLVV